MTRWIFALLGASSPAAAGAQQTDLDAVVHEAVSVHPSVAAMRHQERALRDVADVAGTWPDPTLSVEYSNVPVSTWSLSDHPMSGVQFRLQQQLRPPGWSGLSRAVGDLRAEARGHAATESELRLALAVRRTWWALARTRMLRRLAEAQLLRAEELQSAVRSRYETGAVGQHAVLRLGVLRDRLADDLDDFDQRSTMLEAMLREAVATRTGREFPTPPTVEPQAVPASTDWASLAQEHRPLLAKLQAERHAAEQSARLAQLEAIPDPTVWTGYRLRTATSDADPGVDFVSLGVGLPIPLGSARRAGGDRSAALREAQAVQSMHDALLNEVVAAMQTIVARWRRAQEKTRVYDETLIPAARSAVRTAQADFTVGRADFASLHDAEVELIELERARVAAAVETHIQRAEAIAVLGVTLPGDTP